MSNSLSSTTTTRPDNGDGSDYQIDMRGVVKTFKTAAGPFTALKSVNLRVNAGEFVAVIGKSGSGKSTLLNMLTGIDRPTAGEVYVGNTAVHKMSEGRLAKWRGKQMGIVFQFFQLLPTLTLIENVMLPMDLCGMYSVRERKKRALGLLDLVEMGDQANRLPSAVSGGQQQRVAIARALANNPPILVADEPTGNLDSKTAKSVFDLFEVLVASGKTIVMVTHDAEMAKRVDRAVIVSDGEVIDEYLARTFPALNEDQLVEATRGIQPQRHEPGSIILKEGLPADKFFIVTRGQAEVVLEGPDGSDIVVARMNPGQYFGEIELRHGGANIATIRAALHDGLDVVALEREMFDRLIAESPATRESIDRVVEERLEEHEAAAERLPPAGQEAAS
jgi:ABC-type lipoprotein export system ATPase subunit